MGKNWFFVDRIYRMDRIGVSAFRGERQKPRKSQRSCKSCLKKTFFAFAKVTQISFEVKWVNFRLTNYKAETRVTDFQAE